jgi:hypothetical protein
MKKSGLLPEVIAEMDSETLKTFQRKVDVYVKDGKMAFVLLVMLEFPVLPSEYLGDFISSIVTTEEIKSKVTHIKRFKESFFEEEVKSAGFKPKGKKTMGFESPKEQDTQSARKVINLTFQKSNSPSAEEEKSFPDAEDIITEEKIVHAKYNDLIDVIFK